MSFGKEIVPILGEVAQEEIEVVSAIAEILLASSNQRKWVKLHLPNGQEIYGVAFWGSEGTNFIVADEFLAIANEEGEIDRFWPRRLE